MSDANKQAALGAVDDLISQSRSPCGRSNPPTMGQLKAYSIDNPQLPRQLIMAFSMRSHAKAFL